MDNVKKFILKAKKILLIHMVFFFGLFVYGAVIATFNPGPLQGPVAGSMYLWAAISFVMEVYIRSILMKCPVCGRQLKTNTRLTFFLPEKCHKCETVFSTAIKNE